MRLREREMPMDPERERELAAIDAGLAGLDVPRDVEDLASLARELRSERSAPDAQFATRLDERATEGFRSQGGADGIAGARPFDRVRNRLAAVPARRLIAPVGAAATLLVAVGVALSVSDQLGGKSGTPQAVPVQPQTVQSSGTASPGVSADGSTGTAAG